eukprot:scaffold16982_cov91-Skeletonema_dohrnii-CCMP3373.AAC.8
MTGGSTTVHEKVNCTALLRDTEAKTRKRLRSVSRKVDHSRKSRATHRHRGEEDDEDILKRTIQCSNRGEYREESSPPSAIAQNLTPWVVLQDIVPMMRLTGYLLLLRSYQINPLYHRRKE